MEQPHAKSKLIGLTVTVLAIAVLVILVGTLCTCLCTVGTCVGCDGCVPRCSRIEWLPDPGDAWLLTAPPITAAPTDLPTDAPDADPFGEQTPLFSASPVPLGEQTPQNAIREKQVKLRHDGTDTVTVLMLMNGSDLESDYQEATEDLSEMVRASKSDRVHILVETVGTRKWSSKYGISSRRSERYLVTETGLTLVDGSLGQLDTTIPSTLSDFIRWGAENYPADRYILLLWDHGGGPVYGFGYDEFRSYDAALTIDEMQTALKDGGVYFDCIGMDCCLMSSVEVCMALYDYCDYTLLSEDFEPGSGWEYSGWLSALSRDPAMSTPTLSKIAIDDSVRVCERLKDVDGGTTLALIDEAYVPLLYRAWVAFAYENEDALLSANYSQLRESTGRAHPRLKAVGSWFVDEGEESTLSDYCITDLLSLAENIPSDRSDTLRTAIDAAIVYYNATSDETTLSGLSVTLPYGDREFYDELRRVFKNAGFDEAYLAWLERFTEVETNTGFDFGDWNVWDDSDGYGWGDWGDWSFGDGWFNDLGWLFGD